MLVEISPVSCCCTSGEFRGSGGSVGGEGVISILKSGESQSRMYICSGSQIMKRVQRLGQVLAREPAALFIIHGCINNSPPNPLPLPRPPYLFWRELFIKRSLDYQCRQRRSGVGREEGYRGCLGNKVDWPYQAATSKGYNAVQSALWKSPKTKWLCYRPYQTHTALIALCAHWLGLVYAALAQPAWCSTSLLPPLTTSHRLLDTRH
ncbi:hypothetical protein J6590_011369 [Homalodisca vitripennis]|nr:hypothetical protein J6590_011369 [Homalodisca vitripennis]